MDNEILKFCLEKGCLLDKEILELLSQIDDIELAKELVNKFHLVLNEKFLTKTLFSKNMNKIKHVFEDYESDKYKKTIERLCINLGFNLEVTKERIEKREDKKEVKKPTENNLRISRLSSFDEKKITVEDFVKYFRTRFNSMKNLLQERGELNNLISINKLSSNKLSSIIGIVFSKRITKNKNILIEIEDLTGKIPVLVTQNKPEIFEKAKEIILDEVIAIRGAPSGTSEVFFANDIFFPDSRLFEKKKSKIDESIAFISDIHVGSNKFLENNFLNFIKWLNGDMGDEQQKKEALKIKFLFIVGDSVDGVGIFPGQENLLSIKDIKEQYVKLSELLKLIRKDIKIVICPGQHDAVRVAEPQPVIDPFFGEALYSLPNLYFATNPSTIEILSGDELFNILIYHGASMHSFIEQIDELRFKGGYNHPAQIVKYLLKKRHLAPTHSAVTYIPYAHEDFLMIEKVPDVIVTGDLHRPELETYNEVQIICSSCWQSITPFEEKVGHIPDPCKVPLLNLKTRQIKILDFSDAE